MQNMPIYKYTLCMASVIELVRLHQYPDRTQPNGHMFAIVYPGLRETARPHHQIHDGCGRCNMQSEEEALDTVHANPPTSTHWVAHETDLPYSSLVYTAYAKFVQRLSLQSS